MMIGRHSPFFFITTALQQLQLIKSGQDYLAPV
jgi:hypothetical protein